ncbi:hypothetical protein GRJ2_003367300 [Grus japonensis]|uniref:Uncharacterized protein n=1 Tax=Grus japonensis TaxID=30415 RepID=A0ABC9YGL2_GRUJA
MERGIQYLRELAVREMVYYDPDNTQLPTDPDEVQCIQPTWRKFVWSTPSSYANSLAVMDWEDKEESTVEKMASRLWQYEESLSSSLVSTVEKLSWEVQQLEENMSYSPPVWTSISAIRRGSQQLTVLEAEVSLTGNEWEKHPTVTGPEDPCILGIDYLRRGYFKDPKGYRVEEQQVPIATTTVHQRQYHTNRDSLVPIHKYHQLEGQGVISRTRSPFNRPIWPVRKSNGEWRLTVDYRGLNEAMPLPMSAAMPDMLELQYELESKKRQGNLWQQAGQLGEAGFKLKDSGGGVQSGNAHAIASNWGISSANQSSDKCPVAASQDENQKANHLKGMCDYGGPSCTPPGKPPCSITPLKCLYTNARSRGNKQEELEVCVRLQGQDLIAITETWWDSSQDWNAVMDGYVLFRKDRPARRGGGVALYVREQLECIEIHIGVDEEQVESLWVSVVG